MPPKRLLPQQIDNDLRIILLDVKSEEARIVLEM